MKIEIDNDLLDEIIAKRLKEYLKQLRADHDASEEGKLRVGIYDHNPNIDRAIMRKMIDSYTLILEYDFYGMGDRL